MLFFFFLFFFSKNIDFGALIICALLRHFVCVPISYSNGKISKSISDQKWSSLPRHFHKRAKINSRLEF